MKEVWLNGSFVPAAEARVSAFDAGIQLGVGLFETMFAVGELVLHADRHVARLAGSARALGLTESLREAPLVDAIVATVRRSGLPTARLRLTLTGGDLGDGGWRGAASGAPRRQDPTILIVAQPPTDYPATLFERGATVSIADQRANPLDPFAGHKTLAYWPRIRALQFAAQAGAAEALWFSVSNHLVGGCVSNVLLVRDGAILTPYARGEEVPGALPAPVLPGIVRGFAIETAAAEGIAVERRMLSIEDLLGAEEVMLTNSGWGVLPVVAVEKASIGDGTPGPVTRRMRDAWIALRGG